MAKSRNYTVDPKTLRIVVDKDNRSEVLKAMLKGAMLLVMAFGWVLLYISVLGFDLPKTALLKRRNAEWTSMMDRMNSRLDPVEQVLEDLGHRDDHVYRSVFGMDEIPQAVRHSGFGGVNRYSWLEGVDKGSALRRTSIRLDKLTKEAYVQSKSFDEIEQLSKMAGDMASHIPAICPICTDSKTYHLSSPFGYRHDPFNRYSKMHTGMDFACNPGNPVYSTADGVVEKVKHELFGYGNSVMINHGFGYKTRYAHLKTIKVAEGQLVHRGENIATTGSSGRSTGPHLHYEVMYKNDFVNPWNFMDLTMSAEDYMELVKTINADGE